MNMDILAPKIGATHVDHKNKMAILKKISEQFSRLLGLSSPLLPDRPWGAPSILTLTISPQIKWPVLQADDSLPFSAEIKKD